MIDLVKMVSLIAKNESDKPALIDFNGRVGCFFSVIIALR